MNLDDLIRRYEGGEPLGKLAAECRFGYYKLRDLFLNNGVKIRSKGEASTIGMRKRYANTTLEDRKTLTAKANKARRGMKDTPETIAKRATSLSPIVKAWWDKTTPEQRAAQVAAAHSARRGQKDSIEVKSARAASKHKRLNQNTSPHEKTLKQALEEISIQVDPQRSVGPYNIDLPLDELPIAVEVERYSFVSSQRTIKRLKYLLDSGWMVLYVVRCKDGFVPTAIAQQVAAFCDLARRDETVFGKYGMIDGKGQPITPRSHKLDGLPRVKGF